MKRSEMIKELIFYYQTDEFDSDHDARINANRVLNLVERMGMSPPSISIPTKAIFNGVEINVGNITTVRIWEPEDETK